MLSTSYQYLNRLVSWPRSFLPSFYSANTDAAKVTDWLSRINAVLSRFEKTTHNAVYPLMEKEVMNMTALLKAGREISRGMPCNPTVATLIDQEVRPKVERLQATVLTAQKKMAEQLTFSKTDARLVSKWDDLGLEKSILASHADCARFLMRSGLAFVIVGYRETCGNNFLHDIKLDADGHPLILMHGRFERWEAIAQKLEYNPKTQQIQSRTGSGGLFQVWNYFHRHGLIPVDRFHYKEAFDSYELSQTEYECVLSFSKRFYGNHPERDPGIPKNCVVEFFSTPDRRWIPHYPIFDNLARNLPAHVGMRVITSDKKVYSFGWQISAEDREYLVSSAFFQNIFATAGAKVAMRDPDEFRENKEGRITTCIPTTLKRAQDILSFVDSLKNKQLRHQFERQNCTSLMLEVMQRTGYDVDVSTSALEVALDALPSLHQLPWIGGVIGKVQTCAHRVWSLLPGFITKPLCWAKKLVLYIPAKMGTILVNFTTILLGAAKSRIPLQNASEELLYNKKGIQYFSTVVRSWRDIFKSETSSVNHSKLFIDWQKQQKSTFIEPPSKRPKLAIVPPLEAWSPRLPQASC